MRNTFLENLNLVNSNFQFLHKKFLFSSTILMAGRSIITINLTYFFWCIEIVQLVKQAIKVYGV